MNNTHEKRPYKATCTQFDGTNQDEIIGILSNDTTYATRFESSCIMVRFDKPAPGSRSIETLTAGWWVCVGENEVVKCYDDYTFRLKYRKLDTAPKLDVEHWRYDHAN